MEEPVKPYRRRAAARCVSLLLSSCTVFSKPLNFFPERFFHNKRKDLSAQGRSQTPPWSADVGPADVGASTGGAAILHEFLMQTKGSFM